MFIDGLFLVYFSFKSLKSFFIFFKELDYHLNIFPHIFTFLHYFCLHLRTHQQKLLLEYMVPDGPLPMAHYFFYLDFINFNLLNSVLFYDLLYVVFQ